MISRSTRYAVALSALAVFTTSARAQSRTDLEAALNQYGAVAVRGYVQPLADVLVANLSLGYAVTASPSGRLSFGFELVSMAAEITDNLRVYTVNTPQGFSPSSVQTPTVFGGDAPTVNGPVPGTTYRGADGIYRSQFFPSAAPQFRVGGLFGTDVAVRYMSSSLVPVIDEKDFPELKLMGVGISHSLSQYLLLPIDISVAGSYNSLTFGDIIDLKSNALGVNVGKSFGFAAVSAGVLSEGGSMHVTYTSNDPNASGTVDANLSVKRATRMRLGGALNLGFARVFGDAAFGGITSYAAGLRLGF